MSALAFPTPRSRAAEESRRWQRRRAQLLHEACRHVAGRLATGEKLVQAIRGTARKFRGRSLGGGRRLPLSIKSLVRHWYVWTRKRGEAAFPSRYVAGRTHDLDPLLLRLIIASCIHRSKSVSEILVSLAPGNRDGRASLGTIFSALPVDAIRSFLRAERRLIAGRKRTEEKLLAINAKLGELRSTTEQKFLSGGTA